MTRQETILIMAYLRELYPNGKEITKETIDVWYDVLKDYDFDLLKIDMVFLKNFEGNQNSRKIIKSILELAKSLDMKTLTEGVETKAAVDFLHDAGCGRLQGYFYGKPMPYEEVLTAIDEGKFKLSAKLV